MNRRFLSAWTLASLALAGCLSPLPPPAPEPLIGRSNPGQTLDQATSEALEPPPTASVGWRALSVQPVVWAPPLISDFADTLKPGVVIFWVPDSSLPLASVRFVWPEGRFGLTSQADADASMLGDLLLRGGTARFTPAQLEDTLEFLAAGVSVSVGMVRSTANVAGLTRDLPFLLEVLSDALVAPRFDTARLSIAKSERIQDIEHRFDTPAQALSLAWDRVAFGPSPWTELSDSLEIRNIGVKSLQAARAGRFSGRKLWIAVAGRFDRTQTRQQLSAFLARLEAGAVPAVKPIKLDSLPALPDMMPPGVVVFDKPGNQSQIRIGTRFVRRDHPDYYPLMLASEVLGQGGFGSRLVERVRSDEGLAYHVSSFVGSDYDRVAMIGVTLQTKVQSTSRALVLVRQEIQRLADSGFRAGELGKARKGMIASVPSLFDTPEGTADMLIQSAAWGRSNHHFVRYMRAMDTIPDSTVLRVFRKWFVPESMRVVVSGPAAELSAPFADGSPALSSWGPVRVWTEDSLRRR
ncbi:MAG: insulinase family protein [Fibrobacteres bacterium]|nr:insulinase family protein [Fibrobacterota bacterium]